jgi:FMN-dependent oxidoreductase (nitrilotriacetate monooxygenase family)
MKKEILLNAFNMVTVDHIAHGMWRHPRDRSESYNDLQYWLELAKVLEEGLFDGIFLADVIGVYDVYQNSVDPALRNGSQVPLNDPTLIAAAMSVVTKHLGFGITCNLSYEPPYLFARRFSTLDHLTKGRAGWNIVTGYVDSGARALGGEALEEHDRRYDKADDYLDIVYKLWEGSWEEGAVLRDKVNGIFTQPDKVHRILHEGPYHRIDAIHPCEPSPQRTPVLYQAGSSNRGQEFAGRHAECIFVGGRQKKFVKSIVEGVRQKAVNHGRRADDVKAFLGLSVVVAETDKEAKEKFEEYRRYTSFEGKLVHLSSRGNDYSQYDLDEPVRDGKGDDWRSKFRFTDDETGEPLTLRKYLEKSSPIEGAIVGSPSRVADELQSWIEEGGVDGFNLTRIVNPETYVDFVRWVVPELQNRGIYKTEYREGTLREKLFGNRYLPERHRAASFRTWRASDSEIGRLRAETK